jgi:hypothetical protein
MINLLGRSLRSRLTVPYGVLLALALVLYAGGSAAYFMAHGGTILLDHTPGVGCRFEIQLPVDTAKAHTDK